MTASDTNLAHVSDLVQSELAHFLSKENERGPLEEFKDARKVHRAAGGRPGRGGQVLPRPRTTRLKVGYRTRGHRNLKDLYCSSPKYH